MCGSEATSDVAVWFLAQWWCKGRTFEDWNCLNMYICGKQRGGYAVNMHDKFAN